MTNGIDLIILDHREVDDLFARFAQTGDGTLIGVVIDKLTAHDDAENAALYPLLGAVLGDEAMVTRASAAHSEVKKQIDTIKSLEGQPLTDAFDVLRTLVQEHVAEEENEMLPALAEQATAEQLEGLAARILQVQQRVGSADPRASGSGWCSAGEEWAASRSMPAHSSPCSTIWAGMPGRQTSSWARPLGASSAPCCARA